VDEVYIESEIHTKVGMKWYKTHVLLATHGPVCDNTKAVLLSSVSFLFPMWDILFNANWRMRSLKEVEPKLLNISY